MSNYNTTLQTNNSSLEEIITQLNNMPDVEDLAPVLQDKTVTPGASSQTITADSGYDGLDTVTVNAIPSTYVKPSATKSATTYTPKTSNQTIAAGTYCSGAQTIKGDTNLIAGNIKSGTSIFGVGGTYTGEEPTLQSKTVSPSASSQTVTADSGYDGLSMVTVNACEGTALIVTTNPTDVVGYQYAMVYDNDLVSPNIKSGVSILGVTGTYEGEAGLTVEDVDVVSSSVRVIPSMPTYLNYNLTDGTNTSTAKFIVANTDPIVPEVIKSGTNILGVTGTYEGSGSGSVETCTLTINFGTNIYWHGYSYNTADYYNTYFPYGENTQSIVLNNIRCNSIFYIYLGWYTEYADGNRLEVLGDADAIIPYEAPFGILYLNGNVGDNLEITIDWVRDD